MKNLDDKLWLIYIFLKEKKWYNPIFLSPFGSYNYGLSTSKSDLDCIAVVIPTMEQLIKRETISKEVELPNNLWHMDVKDSYSFFEKITNLNYLEAIYSKHQVIDADLFSIFDFL